LHSGRFGFVANAIIYDNIEDKYVFWSTTGDLIKQFAFLGDSRTVRFEVLDNGKIKLSKYASTSLL
jgi:hypothetical protein